MLVLLLDDVVAVQYASICNVHQVLIVLLQILVGLYRHVIRLRNILCILLELAHFFLPVIVLFLQFCVHDLKLMTQLNKFGLHFGSFLFVQILNLLILT